MRKALKKFAAPTTATTSIKPHQSISAIIVIRTTLFKNLVIVNSFLLRSQSETLSPTAMEVNPPAPYRLKTIKFDFILRCKIIKKVSTKGTLKINEIKNRSRGLMNAKFESKLKALNKANTNTKKLNKKYTVK